MVAPKGNQYAVGNPGGGRPPEYKKSFAATAKQAADRGLTNFEIAELLDIAETTLYVWSVKYQEFSAALKAGREPADDRVERSLYHRANGYTHKTIVLVKKADGSEETHTTTVQVPPDVTACIFWLKNRRREFWRDRHEQDTSGTIQLVVTGGMPKDV
jgi:transposase-like protein